MKLKNAVFATVFATLFLGQIAMAKPTAAASAVSIVKTAELRAAKEHKNVIVMFHASWCGWCHKLDDFLSKPEIAPLIAANYEVIHIVVQEADDKKDLDNPGGDALLDRLGGKDLGIPYYAILSPKNETLAVSKNAKGENIGYPGEDTEIPLFMKMIRSTSSHLSDTDANLIESKLQEEGKKLAAATELREKLIKPIQDDLTKHDYKQALDASNEVIASHPDQASMAVYLRYEALLHVDEPKAVSEIGQTMGTQTAKGADVVRASLIIEQDSLSDSTYQAALSILLAEMPKDKVAWYQYNQVAQAYARVKDMKQASKYQDQAVESAKVAKLPQRVIDKLVETEKGWQKSS